MSDLIDRQAVIDLLRDEYNWDECGQYIIPDGQYLIPDIEKLPSVQPEIIQCDQCKYWDGEPPIADGRCWCILHGSYMNYCSDAERKD